MERALAPPGTRELWKAHLNTEQRQTRMKREITLLRLVDHPNILRLYDIIETDKSIYVVTEYVNGGELFDYLLERGKLPRHRVLSILAQLVAALEHCHALSVCHRDLKPENVLMDSEHNVKLADFGMAQMMSKDKLLLTSCGSPHYASPEVVRGDAYDGAKADIWSLGVIIFALSTGSLPFDHDHIPKLLDLVVRGEYETPDFVDDDLSELISSMLQVDCSKRITLAQIRAHEVFKDTLYFAKLPLPSFPPPSESPLRLTDIDPEILMDLHNLDIDPEILMDLHNLGFGSLGTCREKLLREGVCTEKIYYNILNSKKRKREMEMYASSLPILPRRASAPLYVRLGNRRSSMGTQITPISENQSADSVSEEQDHSNDNSVLSPETPDTTASSTPRLQTNSVNREEKDKDTTTTLSPSFRSPHNGHERQDKDDVLSVSRYDTLSAPGSPYTPASEPTSEVFSSPTRSQQTPSLSKNTSNVSSPRALAEKSPSHLLDLAPDGASPARPSPLQLNLLPEPDIAEGVMSPTPTAARTTRRPSPKTQPSSLHCGSLTPPSVSSSFFFSSASHERPFAERAQSTVGAPNPGPAGAGGAGPDPGSTMFHASRYVPATPSLQSSSRFFFPRSTPKSSAKSSGLVTNSGVFMSGWSSPNTPGSSRGTPGRRSLDNSRSGSMGSNRTTPPRARAGSDRSFSQPTRNDAITGPPLFIASWRGGCDCKYINHINNDNDNDNDNYDFFFVLTGR
eukprot:g50916.t1